MAILNYKTYQIQSSPTTGSDLKFKIFDNIVHERHVVGRLEYLLDRYHSRSDSELVRDWFDTTVGKWVVTHCKEVTFKSTIDFPCAINAIVIYGYLTANRKVEFLLKFS